MPTDEAKLMCLLVKHKWRCKQHVALPATRYCERCGLKQLILPTLNGVHLNWVNNGYMEVENGREKSNSNSNISGLGNTQAGESSTIQGTIPNSNEG